MVLSFEGLTCFLSINSLIQVAMLMVDVIEDNLTSF